MAKQKTKYKYGKRKGETEGELKEAVHPAVHEEPENGEDAPPIEPELPGEAEASNNEQRAAVENKLQALEEAEEEAEKASNSVVAAKFKDRYIAHARESGVKGKAARRSNWDWLSQQIATECLNEKYKIDINKFLAILEANGVDHTKWDNRNRGWEGRLRMTGRVALQRVVADGGMLKFPDGREEKPPGDFVAKYKTKE